jgi:hypothetical protein
MTRPSQFLFRTATEWKNWGREEIIPKYWDIGKKPFKQREQGSLRQALSSRLQGLSI